MSSEDRWLLPRRQTEYPAWDLVSEAKLHARREATFLALASLVVVAATSLIAFGGQIVDVSAQLAPLLPELSLPIAPLVPVGVAACTIGFVAVMVACDLYGRRRATALVWAGVFACIAQIALVVATGGDPLPSLALATGFAVAHAMSLLTYDAARARMAGRNVWLRAIVASLIAQPIGWAACAGVTYAGAPGTNVDHLVALAAGSTGVALAAAVVSALPLTLICRALRLFLRVARHEAPRLPPAEIIDEDSAPHRPAAPAFSPVEMRFFTEGDQLDA